MTTHLQTNENYINKINKYRWKKIPKKRIKNKWINKQAGKIKKQINNWITLGFNQEISDERLEI